jgi:hypothetical protein
MGNIYLIKAYKLHPFIKKDYYSILSLLLFFINSRANKPVQEEFFII